MLMDYINFFFFFLKKKNQDEEMIAYVDLDK